jgi:hypothetical protein
MVFFASVLKMAALFPAFFMLFAFGATVYQYFSTRKRSGIPDQKGVLEMIRGLPDDYLFPSNNKVWHGTVALHFCFFLMVRFYHSLQTASSEITISSSRIAEGWQ